MEIIKVHTQLGKQSFLKAASETAQAFGASEPSSMRTAACCCCRHLKKASRAAQHFSRSTFSTRSGAAIASLQLGLADEESDHAALEYGERKLTTKDGDDASQAGRETELENETNGENARERPNAT
jgi:hypothetical protein